VLLSFYALDDNSTSCSVLNAWFRRRGAQFIEPVRRLLVDIRPAQPDESARHFSTYCIRTKSPDSWPYNDVRPSNCDTRKVGRKAKERLKKKVQQAVFPRHLRALIRLKLEQGKAVQRPSWLGRAPKSGLSGRTDSPISTHSIIGPGPTSRAGDATWEPPSLTRHFCFLTISGRVLSPLLEQTTTPKPHDFLKTSTTRSNKAASRLVLALHPQPVIRVNPSIAASPWSSWDPPPTGYIEFESQQASCVQRRTPPVIASCLGSRHQCPPAAW